MRVTVKQESVSGLCMRRSHRHSTVCRTHKKKRTCVPASIQIYSADPNAAQKTNVKPNSAVSAAQSWRRSKKILYQLRRGTFSGNELLLRLRRKSGIIRKGNEG